MAYSSLQRRVFPANVTATTYVLAAGMYTLTSLQTALGYAPAIFPLGKATPGDRRRGCELKAIGTGADNSTLEMRLWQVKWATPDLATDSPTDLELALLGTLAATLSTSVGAAASGVSVLSTERLADTYTWTPANASTTPRGISDLLMAGYGGGLSLDATPDMANAPGRAFLWDAGCGDLLVEIKCGTATSGNVILEATT